jgi:formate hydrogenlyase transcriptional activator
MPEIKQLSFSRLRECDDNTRRNLDGLLVKRRNIVVIYGCAKTPDMSQLPDFCNQLASLSSRDQLASFLPAWTKRLNLPGEPVLLLPDEQPQSFEYFLSTQPTLFNLEELMRRTVVPHHLRILFDTGIRQMLCIGLYAEGQPIGVLFLQSPNHHKYTKEELKLVSFIATQLAPTIAWFRAKAAMAQLEKENAALLSISKEHIHTAYDYDEIVGSSTQLQQVFQSVGQVAGSDSTVLILGETGTGKEGIARAIHNASPRRDKLMIKVNCAALPASLIESELFGHEKGSFTGAIERRIGKFELADNSTLFLDEIGELSPELQAKLLRAIQEKEIERIGGKTTIRTDARIVAATNRNLQNEIDAGRFRSDLFYRLNVFPIALPPLRDRHEDIPALTKHFITRYSRKSGRKITGIAPRVLQQMARYHWPGNIRELEHLIERSILMTQGPIIREIHLPMDGKENRTIEAPEPSAIRSHEENERDHILDILQQTKGRIRGEGGAAQLLRLPPTTLHSKMKKLGITKKHG